MSRRISLMLSLCFFLCASCASQPEPVPRGGYDDADDEAMEREAPVQTADENTPVADEPPATQQGPIDLGLGNGDDSDGGTIVINRPNSDNAELDDLADAADLSRVYDRACEVVEDCEGLPELACDGEMECVDNQCVYSCDDDESDTETDESDESEDADELEAIDTFDEVQ